MKEIRIPLEQFDLEAFLDRTIEFLKGWMASEVDPTYALVWVRSLKDVPVFGLESGWDVLSGLAEGKMVFFPFAYADADGVLDCSDGNTYGPTSDDEDSEGEMIVGMEDSVGFLVKVKDGIVIINAGIHLGGACPGPGPGIDLCLDCGVLEGPMEKFIRGFIKG